ncbi:tRNA glutamyl-Q(34) synthetase GluQRS [Maritalea sp.]|uniref:tRNA glutamyl-Q(34) synthetase GluQRS n=1 Tax=Maritalea sp. TaxID=2003361 RepID=UPI003EF2ACD4
MDQPIFRFAPSPNGELHLGHAFSALMTQQIAQANDGKILLRVEDIDTIRCTPEGTIQMLDDLDWVGFSWDEEPRNQSDHFDDYAKALEKLRSDGLVYPCFCSRNQIKSNANGEKDPDGAPLYPGTCKHMSQYDREKRMQDADAFAWRLDMDKAIEKVGDLTWQELSEDFTEVETVKANPAAWGDVILARKFTPTSYHLSVVVDDADQNITHVTRGKDLYFATAVHRVLQALLELPEPKYLHHGLILDDEGKKLSKSKKSLSLAALRKRGWTPEQIRVQLELEEEEDLDENGD